MCISDKMVGEGVDGKWCVLVFGGQIAQTSLSFVRFASRYFVKHHLRQHLKDILQWEKEQD